MKKKRGEKVVSGDEGSAVVGYPSSSTSGCCGGEECCGVGTCVGGGEVRVWGGVLGGGDSRFLRMGGGTASSSDELDGDSGVCAVGEGGCFECVWQKWKKLLKR